MKILVVYFSHSGNNRLLAEALSRRLACDFCPIVEKKRRTMLTVFLDMLFNRTPALAPLKYNLAEYQHIVFASPIWNSKVANPMAALIKREKSAISSYSFISLCGHGTPEQQDKISRQLEELSGQPPKQECELRIGELMPADKKDDIKAISSYRVTEKDLQLFENRITAFCASVTAGP